MQSKDQISLAGGLLRRGCGQFLAGEKCDERLDSPEFGGCVAGVHVWRLRDGLESWNGMVALEDSRSTICDCRRVPGRGRHGHFRLSALTFCLPMVGLAAIL